MWVVPERIGEDSEPRRRFLRSFTPRQSAGVETPTRVDIERNRAFLGLGGQLLGVGTQFDSNPYAYV